MISYKTLSVRQPWADLIISGTKDIENRTWSTVYRGRLFIHASRFRLDEETIARFDRDPAALHYGAVIGFVDLVDVVQEHSSTFFSGPYGWVLANPQRIDPVPMRGQLGLFNARVTLAEGRHL